MSDAEKWPELTRLARSRPVADDNGNEIPCAFNARRAEAAALLAREADAATLRKHAEGLAAALSGLLDVIDRLGTVNTPAAVKAREQIAAWRSGPGAGDGKGGEG